MRTVIVAGHICMDLVPELDREPALTPGALLDIGALSLRPGGCVANTGGDLAALGVPVSLAADVGADPLAETLLGMLAARGLDVHGLRGTALPTSYSIVVQSPGRDRTFWHHVGANARFDGSRIDVRGAHLLHLGYPSILPALQPDELAPLRALFSRARAAGVTTSLDLAVVDAADEAERRRWRAGLAAVLPLTDVISPSLDDLESAIGGGYPVDAEGLLAAAHDLVAMGAAIAVVSAGVAGLALATASRERMALGGSVLGDLGPEWANRALWWPASVIAEPVTTTGAGDAATAGLLHALLDGVTPEQALHRATRVAAAKVAGRDLDASVLRD